MYTPHGTNMVPELLDAAVHEQTPLLGLHKSCALGLITLQRYHRESVNLINDGNSQRVILMNKRSLVA